MKPASRPTMRLLLALVALTLSVPAFAQTGVVVDGPIPIRQWRNAAVVASSVPAGTVVEIIERDGEWCWVVLPPDIFGTRRVGWLPTSALRISGTPPPEVLPSDDEAPADAGDMDGAAAAPRHGETPSDFAG